MEVVGFLLRDSALEPGEAALAQDLALDLGRLQVERAGDALRRAPRHHRDLLRRHPAQQLLGIHAHTGCVDADGERAAVAIVDAAALGRQAEAPLTLALR